MDVTPVPGCPVPATSWQPRQGSSGYLPVLAEVQW